jgi:hypothetical protein
MKPSKPGHYPGLLLRPPHWPLHVRRDRALPMGLRSSNRHKPGTLGTVFSGAPYTSRTCNRCLWGPPPAVPALQGRCPCPANQLNEPLKAPVAQLDRALPSEGKGHTFESCRVRQCLQRCSCFQALPAKRPEGHFAKKLQTRERGVKLHVPPLIVRQFPDSFWLILKAVPPKAPVGLRLASPSLSTLVVPKPNPSR